MSRVIFTHVADRHLHAFLDEYSDMTPGGIVLYDGEETFWLTNRVLAAPWWRVV